MLLMQCFTVSSNDLTYNIYTLTANGALWETTCEGIPELVLDCESFDEANKH